MKPTVQAGRAIGAEFLRRKIKPLIIIITIVVVVLLAVSIWLIASVSVWWWLLLVPVLVLTTVCIIAVIISRVLLKTIDSTQSKEQKLAVSIYVDKLERVAENIQTPPYVILFRIVRDIIRPKQDGFIASMSRDSQTLAPEFRALVASFS
jgi:hypothetical protein